MLEFLRNENQRLGTVWWWRRERCPPWSRCLWIVALWMACHDIQMPFYVPSVTYPMPMYTNNGAPSDIEIQHQKWMKNYDICLAGNICYCFNTTFYIFIYEPSSCWICVRSREDQTVNGFVRLVGWWGGWNRPRPILPCRHPPRRSQAFNIFISLSTTSLLVTVSNNSWPYSSNNNCNDWMDFTENPPCRFGGSAIAILSQWESGDECYNLLFFARFFCVALYLLGSFVDPFIRLHEHLHSMYNYLCISLNFEFEII